MSSAVCLDASVVVRLVTQADDALAAGWRAWLAKGTPLVAPTLLLYEVAKALHRYRVAGLLDAEQARRALDAACGLPIDLRGDPDLHRRALQLAADLGMSACYDAHYVAVAERFDAPLWSLDERLFARLGERVTRAVPGPA